MSRLRQKTNRVSLLSAYSADMGQLISRKRAERSLRAAAIESALASRAKTEFLTNMSHELRTPLNAIIGFGDLIQQLADEESKAGTARDYATHISRAGRHLLQIISDILDISKIEAGKFGRKPIWIAENSRKRSPSGASSGARSNIRQLRLRIDKVRPPCHFVQIPANAWESVAWEGDYLDSHAFYPAATCGLSRQFAL